MQDILLKHLPADVKVWVFGSRDNWTTKDSSDLDLALEGESKLSHEVLSALKDAFEDSALPYTVDVVDLSRVGGSFRRIVELQKVLLPVGTDNTPPEKWRTCTLGDWTDNFDAMLIPVKERDRRPGRYPYYGASGVVDYVDDFLFDGEYLLIAEDGENLRTRNTPIALLVNGKFWVNNHAHIVQGNGNADTRFLKYALSALDISGYLTGSTMPKLTQGNMNSISIPSPPFPEQQAIAHVLGTLDDKIELNRRMNETLEAMTRALFKSWFVDFDPVRAKMDGRWRRGESLPGLPADLYDLFPDRMVPSELGEIPEGWEVKPLGELVELAYGKALRAVDRKDGPVPVYGSNGQVGWHDKKLVGGPGIVVGRKGNPGVVTWAHGDFFPIDTTFYVVPRDANGGLPFLFFALTGQDLPSVSADSAVPGLNRNLAYMNQQLIPDKRVLAEFNDYTSAIFSRRHRLEQESRDLAAQRDALLPGLVSGEVKVGEG
ncbi:MAG: restriction endonuclease subunit S [Chloroflexi bacterium]|nr:restriction endonuclease subunit S [Chloroflexota bacterium]